LSLDAQISQYLQEQRESHRMSARNTAGSPAALTETAVLIEIKVRICQV